MRVNVYFISGLKKTPALKEQASTTIKLKLLMAYYNLIRSVTDDFF
jgi:hypothetical protein